jgi:hypothetical protein
MTLAEPFREQFPGVCRREQQDIVVTLEMLDEGADPGGVAASFTTQADGDFRHRISSTTRGLNNPCPDGLGV